MQVSQKNVGKIAERTAADELEARSLRTSDVDSDGIAADGNKLDTLIDFLSQDERVRALCQQPLPAEYSYASLSTMLLDAIFSIGVRYGQVKAVVARHAKCQQYDPWQFGNADPYPLPKLIMEGREGTAEQFASKLGNRCLTSTRSGILKAMRAYGRDDLTGRPSRERPGARRRKPAIWLICASGGLGFHEFGRSIEVRSEVERGEVGIESPFL